MSKSEKRCWQTLAAIVTIIGLIFLIETVLISSLISDWICILFAILALLLVVIGTTSYGILQFYY